MTKEETAEWMGYDTVEAMDRDHDNLHKKLAEVFDVISYSMVEASGAKLFTEHEPLAWAEENAVLHTQRWLRMIGYYDG